ncbi:MAG: hypothetical protein R3E02_04335 [Blastomonas sp.]
MHRIAVTDEGALARIAERHGRDQAQRRSRADFLARGALILLALATFLMAALPSMAQQGSATSFRLRPGNSEEQPPSNVQGPVDSESLPPRQIGPAAAPSPAPSGGNQAQPVSGAQPSRPSASGATVQPLPQGYRQAAQQGQADAGRANQREAPASAPSPASAPAANNPAPEQPAGGQDTATSDPPVAAPPLLPGPATSASGSSPAGESTPGIGWWIFALAALGLIAGLALWYWHRREPAMATVPQIALPPLPANPPPAPKSPVATDPEPVVPPAIAAETKGPIQVTFQPVRAETTLINAVIAYRIDIANNGERPVGEIAIHGAIRQAEKDMPREIAALEGASQLPLLHNADWIAPGENTAIEGTMRLPLQSIEPIRMANRLLFVPVAHFWIGYTEPDNSRYAIVMSYVLGEESDPPTAKVAPIRLELGPRRIHGIGQRPLIAA